MGLDRHLQEQSSNEKSDQFIEENSDCGTSTIENSEDYMPEGIEIDPELSTDVSQASHASQMSNDNCEDSTGKGDDVHI